MRKFTISFATMLVALSIIADKSIASDEHLNSVEVENVLIEYGYESEDLNYYTDENKLELAEVILEDPEKLEVNTTYVTVDNVATIEYYTNTSDEELFANGATEEEIDLIREKLKKLLEQPVEEIKENYNLSNGEVGLIKNAVEENPNYVAPEDFGSKEVTASAQIATSKLSFTQSVKNNSTSTKPNYKVTLNHNWKTPFFFDIVSDNVAAAWGGNLDVKGISGLVFYNKGDWYSGKFGSGIGSVAPSSTVTPNKGIVFSFKQKLTGRNQAKSGTYNFTVFQNKKKGYSTSLVSQYAHKRMTVSNISISKTPTITIGTGKDVSAQRKANINY
ncbi:hypothetical protein ACM26V_15520 [Salipaludibacillus sp. HK11]|uniref:hypothetical protein n=1 Tax=Salipaludibacillus sp. HK11 TaxID=3394320 RepID=UPI0039FC806C